MAYGNLDFLVHMWLRACAEVFTVIALRAQQQGSGENRGMAGGGGGGGKLQQATRLGCSKHKQIGLHQGSKNTAHMSVICICHACTEAAQFARFWEAPS